MAERRDLDFASLDDVILDVERLLAGHDILGRWSLAQICHHLATGIRLTLDAPLRPFESTRETEIARRRFFHQGKFPEGMEAPIPALIPPPGLDAANEAEALREVIGRFASATGPFPAHPRLGPMTKDEWAQFHCLHCAHHLGFAVPQGARIAPA
jgi:hypothetical protein